MSYEKTDLSANTLLPTKTFSSFRQDGPPLHNEYSMLTKLHKMRSALRDSLAASSPLTNTLGKIARNSEKGWMDGTAVRLLKYSTSYPLNGKYFKDINTSVVHQNT